MRRILITGSNRGIGLELVERYLQQPDTRLFATCRQPAKATALQALAAQYSTRLKVIPLEVTDQQSINEALAAVQQETDGLEMLVNNAGVLPGGMDATEANAAQFGFLEADAMLDVFRINTVAPVMVAQAFVGLLRNGINNPRMINVSSNAGSISTREDGIHYSYAASKVALNMITRGLAHDLRSAGIIVISIHPGWIQTDMGGQSATLAPSDTLSNMVKVMDNLTMADTSAFFKWDGSRLPW